MGIGSGWGGHWLRMKPPKILLVDGHPCGEVWVSWVFWLWLKQVEVVYRYGEGWNVSLEKLWRFPPWKGWLWDTWWYPQNRKASKAVALSKPTGHNEQLKCWLSHVLDTPFKFFLAVVLDTFYFYICSQQKLLWAQAYWILQMCWGPQNLVPKPMRQSAAKTLWCWEHIFFLGISPGFRCDCCASRQREAHETEGAFHFVGISAPTRRIDALQMAFPCIFGVFCLWVVVCVGRTCINFMWQMVSGKDWYSHSQ